ncbi:hypothetical protein [Mycobacterium sp. 155]|uniref:hypothetical protein n=1 Tax=Mycobacterium sp. 155 TaxID=1157943 RepID=UPI0003637FBE|nr:hypothetical protein [Mycobacterium sp. 155]
MQIAGSTGRLLPPPEPKRERPAAARWFRAGEKEPWRLQVRRSVHRPGRAAKVTGAGRAQKMLVLGDVDEALTVAHARDGFVITTFTDPGLRSPRQASRRLPADPKGPVRTNERGEVMASDAQVNRAAQLWWDAGDGDFCASSGGVILARPQAGWDLLTREEISWYIDLLKKGARDA